MRPEGQIESISCDKNIFDKFRASPIKIFSTNFVHRQKKYFRQISRIAKKKYFRQNASSFRRRQLFCLAPADQGCQILIGKKHTKTGKNIPGDN
jgi:hypothetical protein